MINFIIMHMYIRLVSFLTCRTPSLKDQTLEDQQSLHYQITD